MKQLIASLSFVLLCGLYGTVFAADIPATRQALETLKTHAAWPWEEEITPIIDTYEEADFDSYEGIEKAKYMMNILEMHKWGQKITETHGLLTLLFSFQPQDYQDQYLAEFDQASQIVSTFRQELNQEVLAEHPGFDLGLHFLNRRNTGKDVVIAVFDVFEANLLEEQRTRYNKATIESIQNFGDPVALNHGNTVIDIILTLAPKATIVPISAESVTYNDAMAYIKDRADINVVNMSRAFAEKDGELDATFDAHLKAILETKIVAKSIGNTGTDLDENVTPLRESQGLPPVGNLFSYDLKLIKTFLAGNEFNKGNRNLLLAVNLNPFSDQIALSATIPGQNQLAIDRTYSVPAEAIYSWATGNFESGSSFAAPQLAAISALLWEVHNKRSRLFPWENRPGKAARNISRALRKSARVSELGEENTGNGLPNSDFAFWRVLFPNIPYHQQVSH